MSSGSLTPLDRASETVSAANTEGLLNGLLTMLPMATVVTVLLKTNETFVKRTNWQSRTAIVLMPSLFVAALTSEQKLAHRMHEMASESQHGTETVHWAEQQLQLQQQQQKRDASLKTTTAISTGTANTNSNNNLTETQQLASLYQQSVASSGVCIVPGDKLQWYHHFANYTAQYPFRVLSAIAIPSVAYIFYGRTEQSHLQFSQKLMHTRVLGQFTTISLLLAVMGFKEFMDHNGRYISQQQADERIDEMHQVRQQFLNKLEQDKLIAASIKAEMDKAHDEDTKEKKKKRRPQHLDHHQENNKTKEPTRNEHTDTTIPVVTVTTEN
jgi:uncharacterized membrane protein